jgi:hypothetical protein
MYLSYSGFKTFSRCPRAYFYKYIEKPPLVRPYNAVHALYGDTVGRIFELFYRDRIWLHKDVQQRLLALVRPTLNFIIERETKKGCVFNWNEPQLKSGNRSLAEVEEEVRLTIPRGVKIIKHHRLIGVKADAEVVLDTFIGKHKIAGRSDIIVQRITYNDLALIDGKGSRWRDKYVDVRQLLWYALLYWLKFGVIPDQLGFLYWRSDELETSVDWHTVTAQSLKKFEKLILDTINTIESAQRDEIFLAVCNDDCHLCEYGVTCPEYRDTQKIKDQIHNDMKSGVEEGDISF